jgi:plastocyanin
MKRYAIYPLLAILWLGWGHKLRAGDIEGTVSAPKPSDVVVFVEKAPGTFKSDHAEMNQRNKVFIPYVLPVLQGTTVMFKNEDDLQHNVFGVGAEEFNLGNWTRGITREHTFTKTGDVTVLCNVHQEMEGHILVLQNPYFARADAQGKYHIAGVPPGDYVVRAWYRGKTKKADVKIPASGSVSANF